jgi:hypothetical protein
MKSLPPILLLFALLAMVDSAHAQRFLEDDPIRADLDNLPIDEPQEIVLSTKYDVVEHTLFHRPEGQAPRAANVNTLGEVPDSSWFTNRIGVRPMSIEELVRGANRTGGPDLSKPLTIIAGKSGGITPGFTIRDARGDVYFVKFDPLAYPNLSTGPDVLVSKFFHAFGYHVPENHIAYLAAPQLQIGPGAKVDVPGRLTIGHGARVTVPRRGKQPMTPEYLDSVFENAARAPDGRVRVVASRRLPGTPVGPFKFHGTRGDDPNDIFPHEHRRELRGYRVFCAWLNHDDSRSLNTLDMFNRSEGEKGYVKHYLLDFSSTMGSGSNAMREISPQNPRAGNEYIVELGPILKTAFTLGIWERPWRKVRYPDYPEAGRFESDFFEPQRWKPEYANPAFERMLPEDAFWATRIVSRFSEEMVRALVETGGYSNPETVGYLTQTLIQRRDKIVAHYFAQLNPLDGFRLTDGRLEFDNLGEAFSLGEVEAYEYEWFVFDNDSEQASSLNVKGEVRSRRLTIPERSAEFLMLRLRTRCERQPLWSKSVDIYLRMAGGASVVGIEREN